MARGPCFCQNGIMAQCQAGPWKTQMTCRHYEKHTNAERCCNLDPTMSNHCWSPLAQADGLQPAEKDYQFGSGDLIADAVAILENEEKIASCHDCINFACPSVMRMQRLMGAGFTTATLEELAARCNDFADKSTFGMGGAI